MTTQNRSKWYYGHNIDSLNYFIDFNEGGSNLSAQLNAGSYSFEEMAVEIARAMSEADGATLTYSCSTNRANRYFIISSTANFSILSSTGAHLGTSALPLMGFTGTDRTGASTYTSNVASGFEYKPQFLLQEYVDFNDFQQAAFSNINKSASGIVETISFGIEKFMECNIEYATNLDLGNNSEIETNLNGVNELRSFLEYATYKRTLEFMPDRDTANNFTKCVLESTAINKDGIGFKLNELYSRGLANFFESGKLTFRRLT